MAAIREHLDVCDKCWQAISRQPSDPLPTVARRAIETDVPLTIAGDTFGNPSPLLPTVDLKKDIPSGLQNHPRYRILKLLGAGGMGEVYLAEHQVMKRRVALKVIGSRWVSDRSAVQRFRREVESAAKLDHPNIVRAYDAEQARNSHFLVMEYVEGRNLAQVVADEGPLGVPRTCNYIYQVAAGLQHAFEKGMVHRDIKPQNLMLTPDGQVKILDFGLARFFRETHTNPSLTDTGAVMGSPDFMAPEQAQESRRADIRADLYSLGCTFYFLVSGKVPFPEGSAMEKIMAHCQKTPVSLQELRRDLPAELLSIVERMMAKDLQQRQQTPLEVGRALRPWRSASQAGIRQKPSKSPPLQAAPKTEPALPRPAPEFPLPDLTKRHKPAVDPFVGLLKHTCCPHCWKSFPPEDVLWISAHPDLLGDALLGAQQMKRFQPTRFTVDGWALDAKDAVCRELACPHCHLPIARSLLEMEPLYVSIIGSPGCGKSYFLTAMTWMLRQIMPRSFELEFRDADLVANSTLTTYEESLFLHPRPHDPVLLNDLIRKTEEQGDQYDMVRYGGETVLYPRPLLFTVQPLKDHLNAAARKFWARTLCLYDNAGESFAVGKDSHANPVTHHLSRADVLFFLFDPTQDPRFRAQMGSGDSLHTRWTGRQDTFLIEALNRIRRLTNQGPSERGKKPLFMIVTKYDTWSHLVSPSFAEDPWREKKGKTGLLLSEIAQRSAELRDLLKKLTPEVVGVAESMSETVLYMPVSALGRTPRADPQKGKVLIRPADIQPMGVATPMLCGLFMTAPGLVQFIKVKADGSKP